jgi:integrase
MSLYLRKKSWYYDFVHKGHRYVGSFGPVSKTLAKETHARKKADIIEGRLLPHRAQKSPRCDVFAEDYLAWIRANRKPATYQRYSTILRRHVLPVFGAKVLSEITPWHLEQYKKVRKDAGRAPRTINLELADIKAMFNKAQTWGKLAEAPGDTVNRLQVPEKTPRFLSEAEEATLLAACSPALQHIVQVGLLTGVRCQDLTSLRPEAVDLQRHTITVDAGSSKSGKSRTLSNRPTPQQALTSRRGTGSVYGLCHRQREVLAATVIEGRGKKSRHPGRYHRCHPAHASSYLRFAPGDGGRRSPHRARADGTCEHPHDHALCSSLPRS